MSNTETTQTVKTPKRISKRSWLVIGASTLAVIVAAAVATPAVANNIARSEAMAELTKSQADLKAAHAELVGSQTALFDAGTQAALVYTESGEFVTVARVELLADAAPLEELKTVREELFVTAGLAHVEPAVVSPALVEAPKLETTATPTTLEGLNTQAVENEKLAKTFSTDAAALTATVNDLEEAAKSIESLKEDVVASSATFAATDAGFTKATPEQLEALSAASKALADTGTAPLARLTAFVQSFDAAKATHEAKVAEEKAIAEEAQRQLEQRNSNGGSNGNSGGGKTGGGKTGGGNGNGGGGGGGNSGNGGGGGGGNTGGGNGGGGGSQPAPQPNPVNPPPAQVPATFQTNSSYVPIGQCDGAYHSTHRVGWGGTSTSGNTLAQQGRWSATVSGDTVTYYLCF